MKNILSSFIILVLFSCDKNDDDESEINCGFIDCLYGDKISMQFFIDNQNILEIDPEATISVAQDGNDLIVKRRTESFVVTVSKDSPLIIEVENREIKVQIISLLVNSRCCGETLQIIELRINDNTVCRNESCNSIIKIDLD